MKPLYLTSLALLLILASCHKQHHSPTIKPPENCKFEFKPLDANKIEQIQPSLDAIKQKMDISQDVVLTSSTDSPVACCFPQRTYVLWHQPVIALHPTWFFMFPQAAQQFILAHELAHYKLEHLWITGERKKFDALAADTSAPVLTRLKAYFESLKIQRNHEYEADLYAVKTLGSTTGALQSLALFSLLELELHASVAIGRQILGLTPQSPFTKILRVFKALLGINAATHPSALNRITYLYCLKKLD